MTVPHSDDSRWRRPILAAIVLFAVVAGARDLTSESSGMLGGDMARYLMDGVFVRDLAAHGGIWNFDELTRFAERYYARYPALSLGHHPPLPYFTLAPFFAVFGVSVFAARVAAICWFVLALWSLYSLAKRLAGWQAASWASALFVTNLFVLRFGQYVLSEMPALAMVLVSMNALILFCETRRRTYFAVLVLAVTASLFARPTTIFMFPVYGVVIMTRLRLRDVLTRRFALMVGVGALLVVPLIVLSLGLAPSNVALVTMQVTRLMQGIRKMTVAGIIEQIISTHLSLPVALVSLAGAVVLIVRRDRLFALAMAWALSVIGGTVLVAGGIEPARYAFGAMPAYFLLAAGVSTEARTRIARVAAAAVLAAAVLWQGWLIRDVRPTGAGGYESAAQYVIDHSREPAVLYDSSADTGYFVFFVRKHDPEGRLVVLRADKVMAATLRGNPVAKGEEPDSGGVYAALRNYGVRFVVVEDRPAGSRIVRRLHGELSSDVFIERLRIPIGSRSTEAQGVDLVIYEYRDAQPADLDAELNIGLPLGNRRIKLRFGDLVRPESR